MRRDEANQPIAHHLVWFPPDGQTRQVAPTDWGPQLVSVVRAPYDAVSPIFMESALGLDPHQRIRQLFAAELAQLSPRVRVEGPAIMIYRTDVVLAVDESFATRARWWRRWPRVAALLVWLGVALLLWLVGLLVR